MELRERAVRMVLEVREQTGEKHGVITRVARDLGVGTESLRGWVNQAEVDAGTRGGTSTADALRIAELEREVRELRQANDILKAASVFSSRPSSTVDRRGSRLHRRDGGSSRICSVLEIAPSIYYDAKSRPPAARAIRDAVLMPLLLSLWAKNYSVYGRRKMTKAARKAGHDVGRDQVARLMLPARHPGREPSDEAVHDTRGSSRGAGA